MARVLRLMGSVALGVSALTNPVAVGLLSLLGPIAPASLDGRGCSGLRKEILYGAGETRTRWIRVTAAGVGRVVTALDASRSPWPTTISGPGQNRGLATRGVSDPARSRQLSRQADRARFNPDRSSPLQQPRPSPSSRSRSASQSRSNTMPVHGPWAQLRALRGGSRSPAPSTETTPLVAVYSLRCQSISSGVRFSLSVP